MVGRADHRPVGDLRRRAPRPTRRGPRRGIPSAGRPGGTSARAGRRRSPRARPAGCRTRIPPVAHVGDSPTPSVWASSERDQGLADGRVGAWPGSPPRAGPHWPRPRADRQRPHRDPARHLDDRQERVDPPQHLALDRDAQDRQDRQAREHPRQVRRAPGPGDQDVEPPPLGLPGIGVEPVRRPVRRDDPRLVGDPQALQDSDACRSVSQSDRLPITTPTRGAFGSISVIAASAGSGWRIPDPGFQIADLGRRYTVERRRRWDRVKRDCPRRVGRAERVPPARSLDGGTRSARPTLRGVAEFTCPYPGGCTTA